MLSWSIFLNYLFVTPSTLRNLDFIIFQHRNTVYKANGRERGLSRGPLAG